MPTFSYMTAIAITKHVARTTSKSISVVWLVLALLSLGNVALAAGQSFATGDLAGTWRVFQLATPSGNFSAGSIRSFNGEVTFDGTGTVAAGTLTDDQPFQYTVTGALTVSAAGLVDGTLTLHDGLTAVGILDVREARILQSRHTVVGASTILGNPGLFPFVRLRGVAQGDTQTFSLTGDVANDPDGTGNYDYHEITPSNDLVAGDASWTTGSITFHGDSGCTEADLMLADGTVRAARTANPTSFG